MVTYGRAARWTRRLLCAIGGDLRGLRAAMRNRNGIGPGLHAYHVDLPGAKRRFHLSVDQTGSAVLIVDATDAIHLNPTATLLAHLALRGTPLDRAAKELSRTFRGVAHSEAIARAKEIYSLIDRLSAAAGPCVTCGLTDVRKSPLFSLSVSSPYKADLALTYGCNNACSHCYSQQRGAVPQRNPLTVSQWRRVLRRLAAIGIPHVIFTGGEPTLVDALPELIRQAVRLGLLTGLNTNGRRLSDPLFATSLRAAGLDHVQITLESHRPDVHDAMTGADSFHQTLGGIQNALAVGLHTITNTTLTRRNIEDAGETVEFLHRLGLKTFAANGMIYAGGGRNSRDAVPVDELAPVLANLRARARTLGMRFLWYTPTEYCRLSPLELELGPRRCNAGEYSICIEPSGDVLPCQSCYQVAGNILRDPWQRIWQSELFLGFRRRVADPRGAGLPERCWSCPDLPLCAGGCRLEREFNDAETSTCHAYSNS